MYIEEGHGHINHHDRTHWSVGERQNGDSSGSDKLHVKGSPESDLAVPGGMPRSLSDTFPLEDNNKIGGLCLWCGGGIDWNSSEEFFLRLP